MASYQKEIKKLGIQPSDFMKVMDIKSFEYHANYKTLIYQNEIRKNVMNFIEYKISFLQKTLEKMKANV
jgi:hypothetical protein